MELLPEDAPPAVDARCSHPRPHDELIPALAHDLRTPLTVIKGSARTLLHYGERLSVASHGQLLEDIDLAATRLNTMIDHLLDVWRLERGEMPLSMKPVDVRMLARRLLANARTGNSRRFASRLPVGFPRAQADPTRVAQTLQVLLECAAELASAQSLLEIGGRADGPWLSIWVGADVTGATPGPEPAEAASAKMPPRLPLALCQRLVEAQGGRLWMERPAGRVRFVFTLPSADGAGAPR